MFCGVKFKKSHSSLNGFKLNLENYSLSLVESMYICTVKTVSKLYKYLRAQLTVLMALVQLLWPQFIPDFCLDHFSCQPFWSSLLVWKRQFVFRSLGIFWSPAFLLSPDIIHLFHVGSLLVSLHQHFGQLMECTLRKLLQNWLLLRLSIEI